MAQRSPLGDRIAQQREVLSDPESPYRTKGSGGLRRELSLAHRTSQEDRVPEEPTGEGLLNAAALLARVGGPTLGGFFGPIGGAAGGALGEGAAQILEQLTGQREGFNPKLIATETALGAIPMSKLAKLSRLRRIGAETARGAGIGGIASTATQLAAEGEVDPGKAALDALLGGGMGGTIGALATRGSLRGGQQGYTNLPADWASGNVIEALGGQAGVLKKAEGFSASALLKLNKVLNPQWVEKAASFGVVPEAALRIQRGLRERILEKTPPKSELLEVLDLLDDLDLDDPENILRLKRATGQIELQESGADIDRINELLGEMTPTQANKFIDQPLSADISLTASNPQGQQHWPKGKILPDESKSQTLAKRLWQAASTSVGGLNYELIPADMPYLHHFTKPVGSKGVFEATSLRPRSAPDFVKMVKGQEWVKSGADTRDFQRTGIGWEYAALNPKKNTLDDLQRFLTDKKVTEPIPLNPKRMGSVDGNWPKTYAGLGNYHLSLGKEVIDGETVMYLSVLDEWGFNPKTSPGLGGIGKALRSPGPKQTLSGIVGKEFVVYDRIPVKVRTVGEQQVLGAAGGPIGWRSPNVSFVYDHEAAGRLSRAGHGGKGWSGVGKWEDLAPTNLEYRLGQTEGAQEGLHNLLMDGINTGVNDGGRNGLISRVTAYLEGIDERTGETLVEEFIEGNLALQHLPKGQRTAVRNYIKKFRNFYEDVGPVQENGYKFNTREFTKYLRNAEDPETLAAYLARGTQDDAGWMNAPRPDYPELTQQSDI